MKVGPKHRNEQNNKYLFTRGSGTILKVGGPGLKKPMSGGGGGGAPTDTFFSDFNFFLTFVIHRFIYRGSPLVTSEIIFFK